MSSKYWTCKAKKNAFEVLRKSDIRCTPRGLNALNDVTKYASCAFRRKLGGVK